MGTHDMLINEVANQDADKMQVFLNPHQTTGSMKTPQKADELP